MKKYTSKAFSLIEISIVILIIGILIAGAVQGSILVKASKLKMARSLTSNSPVSSINNLVLWLETTSEQSFSSDVEDGNGITTWYDINPQSTDKNNAIQNTAGKNPFYKSSLYNGLPGLLFDGVDDWLSVANNDNLNPGGGGFTLFIVSRVLNNASGFFYLTKGSGNSSTAGYAFYNFNLRIVTDTSVLGQSSGVISGLPSTMPEIYALTLSGSQARFYKNNSEVTPAAAYTGSVTSSSSLTIGSRNGGTLNSNIEVYEIIIFNRLLKSTEFVDINKYLSQKWKITIS